MTATLTYEQRLSELDHRLADLQHGVVEAIETLHDAPEADTSHEQRWVDVSERLKALRFGLEADDYDKDQFAMVATALLDIRDQLDRKKDEWLDVCDQLMIRLERIRHVVRDALDEHVDGVSGNVGAVMEELDRWLPNISDQTIAELVGVDRRSLSRWRRQTGQPRRNLRFFARLVAVLRHNWDEEGIIAWFNRPRRDLDGRRPAALIADPNAEAALLSAARSSRNQYAS